MCSCASVKIDSICESVFLTLVLMSLAILSMTVWDRLIWLGALAEMKEWYMSAVVLAKS